jgi:heterotetrameric sarcosine oxidase gamma subunit
MNLNRQGAKDAKKDMEIMIASPLTGKMPVVGDNISLKETSIGLLHIRGRLPSPIESMAIGQVMHGSDGLRARLRRDEFIVLTTNTDAAEKTYAKDAHITLTNITHGRCVMRLAGARVNEVLAKVCALDFSKFAPLSAAQTSLAKVRALIVRDDSGAYHISVDRSLGAYVWDVLADAAREFSNE